MFCKNERGLERIFRIGLGLGLISWGFWISGTYWLSYAMPTYPIPCWEWSNFISHACLVKVGYGGPKISRGLHPSGYTDNLVHNINDLEKLNPKTDGVRLGHSVGTKKRKEIVIKSIEKKFKIFNARVTERASKS